MGSTYSRYARTRVHDLQDGMAENKEQLDYLRNVIDVFVRNANERNEEFGAKIERVNSGIESKVIIYYKIA